MSTTVIAWGWPFTFVQFKIRFLFECAGGSHVSPPSPGQITLSSWFFILFHSIFIDTCAYVHLNKKKKKMMMTTKKSNVNVYVFTFARICSPSIEDLFVFDCFKQWKREGGKINAFSSSLIPCDPNTYTHAIFQLHASTKSSSKNAIKIQFWTNIDP